MENMKMYAKMIDHSLLHPALTDKELKDGCELAKKFNVASVCIKPYAVKNAVEWLSGSDVLVGCVVGFPHGNSVIEVKIYETEQAILDGAAEIDMVVNIGKVLSEDWEYIEKEIKQIVGITKKYKAILKVIFENDYLPEDKYKVKLCEICTKYNVDYVKTSSGYGFKKDDDGKYYYNGATDEDLILMRKYSGRKIKIKAAGGIRSLDDVKRMRDLGVTRIGASATEKILTKKPE